MLKSTVTSIHLRTYTKDTLGLVKGEDIICITHRGNPDRILLTKDFYQKILKKARLYNQTLSKEELQKERDLEAQKAMEEPEQWTL